MICVGAMLGDSTSSIKSNKEGFPIFNGGTLFKDPVVNMLVSDKRFGSLIGVFVDEFVDCAEPFDYNIGFFFSDLAEWSMLLCEENVYFIPLFCWFS